MVRVMHWLRVIHWLPCACRACAMRRAAVAAVRLRIEATG
jgi:hypothetical protein